MRRRIRTIWPLAVLLAVVVALAALMAAPASAVTAGTIELDAEWYGTGTVTGEAVGTGDGTTDTFSLDNTAVVPDSQEIYLAGVLQIEGGEDDYTFTDATGVIIFAAAPDEGVAITADYTYVTASDTVTIRVEDADLNVPKAYTDEVSDDPDGSIKLFTVTNTPMSPWPANPVTVMDMAGTSFGIASVNATLGDVTLADTPPDIAELMAAAAIPATGLDLDTQPYKPTTLTATLNASPGGAYTVDVTITGVIVITGESVSVLDGSGDQTGESLDNTPIVPGTVTLFDTVNTYTDDEEGVLTGAPAGSGTIDYDTGAVTISGGEASAALTADYDYTDSEVLAFGSGDTTVTSSATFRSVDIDGVDVTESDPLSSSETVAITATNVVYVTYTGAQENEATVNIKSSSDTSGIAVILTETGVDTGIFEDTVTLVATASDPEAAELQAAHGDTVTATYTDEDPAAPRTAVATVDDLPPAISNESPADGSFIGDSTPLFSVDVTDPDVGITYEEWTVTIDAAGLGDVTAQLSVTPITGGYRLEYLVSTSDALDEASYVWTVDVNDKVGTHRILEFEFAYDETAPTLDAAKTGWTWDAEAETPAAADTNSRTTIMATFSEPLDEATVAASDFKVADLVTPSAVAVHGENVFLTIADEMATDATPSVELVGEVSDIAGTAQTEGLVEEAEDDIDPILTVGVDPELGLDETEITVTVTSSEALDGVPTVSVTEADGAVVSVTMTGTDTPWEGTYTLDDANTAGVYAVTAEGTDEAANTALGVLSVADESVGTTDETGALSETLAETPIVPGSLAMSDGTNDFTDGGDGTLAGDPAGTGTINYSTGDVTITTGAVSVAVTADYDYFAGATANFEGDFAAPTASITPADGVEVASTHPWITVEFDEDVEVLEATFDEVDVLAELYAVGEDLNLYTLATVDLEMGPHTISVLAKDLAGNEMEEADSATFTVVVASADIQLYPGWNLASLPLIPDESSIEAVLEGVDVESVWSYDPSPGGWLIYGPGTPSDLGEMTDGNAYWIRMTAPATISVTGVTMPEPPDVPPSYPVVEGWNLIGFKSLEPLTRDTYLANIAELYAVVWAYRQGAYAPLGESENMEPGEGFWIWMTADGFIVPPA